MVGGADALAVTCLDRVAALPRVPVCARYQLPGGASLRRLEPGPREELAHRERLGVLLRGALPALTELDRADPAEALLRFVEEELSTPVALESRGPTAADRRRR
jgi:adenylosuccinate synthase